MNTREQVLELKNQGKNIPEMCKILGVCKGTVGFHLKTLGIKLDRTRSEETKRKISEAQKGKKKNRGNGYKRNQEGYVDPRALNYWSFLKGEAELKRGYRNSIRKSIKKFIIKHNIIPYVCYECGQDENWRGKKMPLILDHINGIRDDNRLENLRFLCSNCDSIQETYKGKNKNNVRNLGVNGVSRMPEEH